MAVATIIPDYRTAEQAAGAYMGASSSSSGSYSGVYGLPSFGEYQDVIARQTAANNAWSAEQAQKQMDFQERMANTAHQREVADLKAAGLNPVLSAGGSGAASLAGAQANPDQSGNSALTTFLANLVSAHTQMEMQRVSAETALATTGMYNATSELVSSMSAAATRYAAAQSAGASMYGADKSLASTVYANESALQRQREQNAWNESHPSSAWQTVSSLLNSASRAAGYSSASDALSHLIKNVAGAAKTVSEQKKGLSLFGGHLTIGNQYK